MIREVNWIVGLRIDNVSVAMLGIPYYWSLIKKQVKRVIEELRPDIIHAHNIYSAKMASEFRLPFVYDDHEYWSKHTALIRRSRKKSASLKNLVKKLGRYYVARLYPRWENDIVSSVPVITVSQEIINDFNKMYHSNCLFLVPNYPTLSEVRDIQDPFRSNKLASTVDQV